MAAYRTGRFSSGYFGLGLLLFLGSLLVLAPGAGAQEEARSAGDLVEIVLSKSSSPAALAAAVQLVVFADQKPAQDAIQEGLGRAERDHEDVAAALLVGAGLARGDLPLDEKATQILKEGGVESKRALLSVLPYSQKASPAVASWLPNLVQAPELELREPALKTQARYAELGKGSGLGTFLILILVTIVGLLVYGASFAKDFDPIKGKVQDWTDKPMTREKLLKEIKAEVEDPVPLLVGYFKDTTLSSPEVAGLLDLLSYFDEDRSHEKLYEFSTNRNDMIKSAAIQSMWRFKDPRWENVLAEFLRTGDEIAQFAAAKALAERVATSQLPLLREVFARTIPGSVQDGLRDAIERLEAAESRGMGNSGPSA